MAPHSFHEPSASTTDHRPPLQDSTAAAAASKPIQARLPELFDENVLAKPYRVGISGLQPDTPDDDAGKKTLLRPRGFPETVPQVGPSKGRYQLREPEFWTCGFFPGTLYGLLERSIKYPHAFPPRLASLDDGGGGGGGIRPRLLSLCHAWSEPLHEMANRTDTHDLGFIVMPALQRDWELTGNTRSLQSILRAANSLASRYIPDARAIRSWDALLKKEITVTDTNENVLIIIDSLCNLDLLFYASAHSGDESLAQMAATHARTLVDTHLRAETPVDTRNNRRYRGTLYSTYHVANVDAQTGALKWRWTAQGYSNESIWSRGQAWAILGYAQTYMWTKDPFFLKIACGVAEYFLYRMETSPSSVEIAVDNQRHDDGDGKTKTKTTTGRYVPLWDFDAPDSDQKNPLRDSSAGVIAANGMLVLSQALHGVGQHDLSHHFLEVAVSIVRDSIDLCLARETATLRIDPAAAAASDVVRVEDVIPGETFEGLLKNATANNNEHARRRCADHGLIYADFYFVEFGNRLLNMGLT